MLGSCEPNCFTLEVLCFPQVFFTPFALSTCVGMKGDTLIKLATSRLEGRRGQEFLVAFHCNVSLLGIFNAV